MPGEEPEQQPADQRRRQTHLEEMVGLIELEIDRQGKNDTQNCKQDEPGVAPGNKQADQTNCRQHTGENHYHLKGKTFTFARVDQHAVNEWRLAVGFDLQHGEVRRPLG
ncbi:MAG: hypothetical protein ACD_39C00446G0001, partial [uncultured bacterium]